MNYSEVLFRAEIIKKKAFGCREVCDSNFLLRLIVWVQLNGILMAMRVIKLPLKSKRKRFKENRGLYN